MEAEIRNQLFMASLDKAKVRQSEVVREGRCRVVPLPLDFDTDGGAFEPKPLDIEAYQQKIMTVMQGFIDAGYEVQIVSTEVSTQDKQMNYHEQPATFVVLTELDEPKHGKVNVKEYKPTTVHPRAGARDIPFGSMIALDRGKMATEIARVVGANSDGKTEFVGAMRGKVREGFNPAGNRFFGVFVTEK